MNMSDYDRHVLDHWSCYVETCMRCDGEGCEDCDHAGEILKK